MGSRRPREPHAALVRGASGPPAQERFGTACMSASGVSALRELSADQVALAHSIKRLLRRPPNAGLWCVEGPAGPTASGHGLPRGNGINKSEPTTDVSGAVSDASSTTTYAYRLKGQDRCRESDRSSGRLRRSGRDRRRLRAQRAPPDEQRVAARDHPAGTRTPVIGGSVGRWRARAVGAEGRSIACGLRRRPGDRTRPSRST